MTDPIPVLTINGSSGNREHHTTVAAGGPLSYELSTYPGAPAQGIPYVIYVKFGEAGPSDITPIPLGTGTAVFSIPPTGGSPDAVLANTLGRFAKLGVPLFAATPLGPGTVFRAPRIPNRFVGLVFTTFLVVPDTLSPNGQAALTNAVVVTVQ